MKIVRVSVRFGETRSANFQSTSAEFGLEAEVDHGGEEDVDSIRDDLLRRCRESVSNVFIDEHVSSVGHRLKESLEACRRLKVITDEKGA